MHHKHPQQLLQSALCLQSLSFPKLGQLVQIGFNLFVLIQLSLKSADMISSLLVESFQVLDLSLHVITLLAGLKELALNRLELLVLL